MSWRERVAESGRAETALRSALEAKATGVTERLLAMVKKEAKREKRRGAPSTLAMYLDQRSPQTE